MNKKDKLKGSKGKFQMHYGNYGAFATINDANNKRICILQIDYLNDKNKVNADHEAQFDNMMLLASSKENYNALWKIQEIAIKALHEGIINDKPIDYKQLVGHLCGIAQEALKATINKDKGNSVVKKKR